MCYSCVIVGVRVCPRRFAVFDGGLRVIVGVRVCPRRFAVFDGGLLHKIWSWYHNRKFSLILACARTFWSKPESTFSDQTVTRLRGRGDMYVETDFFRSLVVLELKYTWRKKGEDSSPRQAYAVGFNRGPYHNKQLPCVTI